MDSTALLNSSCKSPNDSKQKSNSAERPQVWCTTWKFLTQPQHSLSSPNHHIRKVKRWQMVEAQPQKSLAHGPAPDNPNKCVTWKSLMQPSHRPYSRHQWHPNNMHATWKFLMQPCCRPYTRHQQTSSSHPAGQQCNHWCHRPICNMYRTHKASRRVTEPTRQQGWEWEDGWWRMLSAWARQRWNQLCGDVWRWDHHHNDTT